MEEEGEFVTQDCLNCGEEYTADLDAAPDYCVSFCSKGCAEAGGFFEN